MLPLVGYMALFLVIAVVFVAFHLLLGRLVRPNRPSAEKSTIYECGEPTIGSAWIQFDLRFYVVALLFVIFDVEVAFFFPWAEVFGKANAIRLTADDPQGAARQAYERDLEALTPPGRKKALRPQVEASDVAANRAAAAKLAWLSFFDILVFFGVLLVGFAYLWKRGDLAWV